jgi:hypothetical protein
MKRKTVIWTTVIVVLGVGLSIAVFSIDWPSLRDVMDYIHGN